MFDYKRIINSHSMRLQILRMLDLVPDIWMLKLQYRMKTGRQLNLKNPRRYTEKLQWYKLYYRDPLMAQCSDKYEVRKYVKEQGYGHILNKLLGIYNRPEEIDFNVFPEQFVLKDTLGSGGNEILICTDKKKFDIPSAIETMDGWIQKKGKHPGREWVYDDIYIPNSHLKSRSIHRIISEKFIPYPPEYSGLVDYKFFCFSGKCEYVYVAIPAGKIKGSIKYMMSFYNPEYQRLSVSRLDELPLKYNVPKPSHWNEMIQCAQALSSPFPHARIDLYDCEDRIIFGEITFFGGSGYMMFEPDEFDFIIGEKFSLPAEIKNC